MKRGSVPSGGPSRAIVAGPALRLNDPTPTVYRVWIGGLPPKLANRKSNNWKSYHFPRKQWLDSALAQLNAKLGTVPQHERVAVQVTAHVAKVADQDNADSRFRKAAHDLLVLVGMIPDDNAAHLETHAVVQQAIGSAPRKPANPYDLPQWAKRVLRHEQQLGLMLDITVLA